MLYDAYQAHVDLWWPWRTLARHALPVLRHPKHPLGGHPALARLAAHLDVFSLVEMTHRRPPFAIDRVPVAGVPVPVVEEVALSLPFADLLRFRKTAGSPQPALLVVAPMSGHFATLLRDTVRVALADHDVYITDWKNAREVPLAEGRFGLDEYTEHVMRSIEAIHAQRSAAGEPPGVHVLAICQPCVASLAAVALMSEDEHPATPRSLTLMAGPIDCRIAPTMVNKLATDKPIAWFEQNLISRVPWRFRGAMRRVYPGFVQLTAFMSMNLERHVQSLRGMADDLACGNHEKAEATRAFYEEYFAVADLPAEFYLETVQQVFQEYALPRGALTWRGRKVNPAAIRRTALLTVEGERDDICSIGQTMAAQDLCTSIKPFMRHHYVQAGAGHYGVFSGKRWAAQIYPLLRDTVHMMS